MPETEENMHFAALDLSIGYPEGTELSLQLHNCWEIRPMSVNKGG